MSARSMRARLDRLGVGAATVSVPECRHHGQTCGMGLNWPQPYIHDQEDDLVEMVTAARRACGRETTPTRRERWEIHVHERVLAAEIEQRAREVAELIAAQKAKNEQLLAELLAERDASSA